MGTTGSKPRLHYRVQHVEGRTAPLERLLALLPPAVEVVTDYERETHGQNPLRNYLRCLANPPKKATHLVVIQDDALPCKEVDRCIKEAVGERPEDVVSLFVGGLPGRTRLNFYNALKKGERWAPIYFREIHHVVALVWPVALAENFLWFMATGKLPGARIPKSDDAAVGYWARKTRRQVWATVPSLVEHPDDFPSTVRTMGRQGDPGRRAIAFIDSV